MSLQVAGHDKEVAQAVHAGGFIVSCYRVLGLWGLLRKGGQALNKVAEGSAAEEAIQMPTGTINMCSIVTWGWEFNHKSSFWKQPVLETNVQELVQPSLLVLESLDCEMTQG